MGKRSGRSTFPGGAGRRDSTTQVKGRRSGGGRGRLLRGEARKGTDQAVTASAESGGVGCNLFIFLGEGVDHQDRSAVGEVHEERSAPPVGIGEAQAVDVTDLVARADNRWVTVGDVEGTR